MRFKPGCSWWIATLGASERRSTDGVHFCEQIGVTEDEFKDALGRKWFTSTEFPFSTLKSRKVGYARFATVDLINLFGLWKRDWACSRFQSNCVGGGVVGGGSSWAIPGVGFFARSKNLHRQFRCKNPTKDDSSTWFRNQDSSTLDWLRQLRTDLDSMLLSICPKDFGISTSDARKSRDHDFRSE
jgi:hypothetical protein